jgi:hypothetical protein
MGVLRATLLFYYEQSEYITAKNRRTGATLFLAKSFFWFVFFALKKNEH